MLTLRDLGEFRKKKREDCLLLNIKIYDSISTLVIICTGDGMTKTNLMFESPDYINNLTTETEVNPKQWTTQDGESLEIDTETWTISSSTQSAKITEWLVNENNYQMTLDLDNDAQDFIPLSQTFAISMVGQLFPKDLIKYLTGIEKAYNQMKEFEDTPPNPEVPTTSESKNDNPLSSDNQPNKDEEELW